MVRSVGSLEMLRMVTKVTFAALTITALLSAPFQVRAETSAWGEAGSSAWFCLLEVWKLGFIITTS